MNKQMPSRRDFLRMSTATGLALVSPVITACGSSKATTKYETLMEEGYNFIQDLVNAPLENYNGTLFFDGSVCPIGKSERFPGGTGYWVKLYLDQEGEISFIKGGHMPEEHLHRKEEDFYGSDRAFILDAKDGEFFYVEDTDAIGISFEEGMMGGFDWDRSPNGRNGIDYQKDIIPDEMNRIQEMIGRFRSIYKVPEMD